MNLYIVNLLTIILLLNLKRRKKRFSNIRILKLLPFSQTTKQIR
jgi:hypothetical protein